MGRKGKVNEFKGKSAIGQAALRTRKAAGKQKPIGIDPTTSEQDYSPDELEFMLAMDRYKRDNHRPFPTWSETLRVLKGLGYARPQ